MGSGAVTNNDNPLLFVARAENLFIRSSLVAAEYAVAVVVHICTVGGGPAAWVDIIQLCMM